MMLTRPRHIRHLVFAAALLLPMAANAQGANAKPDPASPTADKLPIYEIDPTWPPTLPNDWILGDIRGLFVDDRDHLWVIHMPSSLTPQEIGAAVRVTGNTRFACSASMSQNTFAYGARGRRLS
jgi:hypothetical protein